MAAVNQSDVLILGGGMMGAATAFFLRQRGVSVTLLERGLCGQQASGVNFGNVRRQGRFLPQLPLANRSRLLWSRLPELLGEDVEFLPTGHLRVAYRPEHLAMMEEYRDGSRNYGLELEIIGGNAARDRYPWLSQEVLGGSFSVEDGHANPRLVAPAFARAAKRDGARIVENCDVVAIECEATGFRLESAGGEVWRAPVLQVSAGAWGGRIAASFGEAVPIIARGPQMGVTEPVPYALHPVLGVTTKTVGEVVYLRQVTRGNIVFGGTGHGPADLDTRRAKVMPEITLQQFSQLRRMVPAIGALRIIRTWSGVEGYLRDDRPVMGPSGKVSGLFYAFGFCGHGFQLGPGVGEVMAELIATGSTTTPLAPFHIGRFA
ncbi:NAD(P)/FAD-dependent oxidoreductase [Teichococcus deserti]|uniref:NAD(P)/FAD-dependent oxidoreductase n=1 Tax=Teichococcus deserti TaxID=1817963 RepID=UPI001A9790DA|nr:FAD-dependent oxidoreductase [Pseudoroseomonas deserti]